MFAHPVYLLVSCCLCYGFGRLASVFPREYIQVARHWFFVQDTSIQKSLFQIPASATRSTDTSTFHETSAQASLLPGEAYGRSPNANAEGPRRRPPFGAAEAYLERGAGPPRHSRRVLRVAAMAASSGASGSRRPSSHRRKMILEEYAAQRVRESAVQALGSLKEHAAPHAGAIVARLDDADAHVRRAAAEAVRIMEEYAAPHAGPIVAGLEDADAGVGEAAAGL
ncbi:hypothetical protein CYMTET_15636 [Cymbomonas tetramitiformis]|uniref:Uncharacterized protein n=1 Tax=Cymbomonas tetramitiformis TaxID=36881 RepID=A0AAE0GDT0_9CHLO|nr:hypothetical protein CYMTET_15636 [Cymbomonas tetramitiformis]